MPQITRRELLQLAGLSASGAAMAGCTSPTPEYIESPLHDLHQPPGRPVVFASTCKLCSRECGLHARVKEGRLKKLEGNPHWPSTQGALCALGQAGPQAVYHPQRVIQSRLRTNGGEPVATTTLPDAITELTNRLRGIPGDRIVCILPPNTGHLHALTEALEWQAFVYDPAQPRSLSEAAQQCYGTSRVYYPLDQAKLILSFDADLVSAAPAAQAVAQWRRRRRESGWEQARFLHIGPRFSLTAASADRWLAVRPGSEGVLALAAAASVARAKGVAAVATALAGWTAERAARECDLPLPLVEALLRRLSQTGPALAVPGHMLGHYEQGPAMLQAIGLLNRLLAAPVAFGFEPPLEDVAAPRPASIRELVAVVRRAAAVVIVDQDLVSLCPEIAPVLKTPTVYLTTREDATAEVADIVIPLATFLETWDDAFPELPNASVASLVQPVVNPFAGVGVGDLLLQLLKAYKGWEALTYRDFLRRRWETLCPRGQNFEDFWTRVCSAGRWDNPQPRPVRPTAPLVEKMIPQLASSSEGGDSLFLYLYPAATTGQGRGADLPWLRERFDILTGVAWCSPLEIHPETAQGLGLSDGDVVEFRVGEKEWRAPVVLYTGIRRDTVALPLGQTDTYPLRAALAGPYNAAGDPVLNRQRVWLRKVDKRVLAKVGYGLDDMGRGLAQLERRTP